MKIALVSPYDTAHPGGVFEHIGHLRTEFVRQGHDVTVLAPRGRKGGLEVRDGFYGIGRTVPIPANGSTVRVTFDVTLYTAVKALLRQEQFDVIHLHEPLIPVLPYLVLLNSRSVNVATFHAFRASSPWYTAFKPYMTFMMSRLDARIAVSEPARDFVSQYFTVRTTSFRTVSTHRFRDIEPFTWARDGIPASSSSGGTTSRARASSTFCALCRRSTSSFPTPDWSSWAAGSQTGLTASWNVMACAMSISSGLSRQRNSRATTQAVIYSALPRSPGRVSASCYLKRWRRVDPSLPGTFQGIAAS